MTALDAAAIGPATVLQQAHELLATEARAEARVLLEAGIAAFPDDPDLLRACGTVWAGDGDAARAAGLFARLVALDPADGPGWVSWATTLAGAADRGALDDAAAALARENPASARAW